MPDRAYTFRMPAGIPGECTRLAVYGTTITPEVVNNTAAAAGGAAWGYGQVVIVDANGVRPVVPGDTVYSTLTWGVLIRPFPTGDIGVAFPAGITDFGAGVPPLSGIVNVMRRGFVSAKLNGATAAAKGGGVFAFVNATSAPHQQGGLEAASGTGLVALTNAYFQGPADAQGNTEVAFGL